jgi:hypothetical protein
MVASKLQPFDIVDFVYKTVHGHSIKASVLVPKVLKSRPREKYPTIVNWHGGGFIVGNRLYEGWLPEWCVRFPLNFLSHTTTEYESTVKAPRYLSHQFRHLRRARLSSSPRGDCW